MSISVKRAGMNIFHGAQSPQLQGDIRYLHRLSQNVDTDSILCRDHT